MGGSPPPCAEAGARCVETAAAPVVNVHYVAGQTATAAACPLCGRGLIAHKTRALNGVAVCKKCCHRFASRRQFAWAIDHLIFSMISALSTVGIIIYFAAGNRDVIAILRNPQLQLGLLAYSNILWLGFLIKDGFSGRSPGKVIFGLHVIDSSTRERISFGASFKRNLATYIPFATLIIAVQLLKGPRWGDRWANTMVVWNQFEHCRPFDQRGVLCERCGYNLTGNQSGRCPECGIETMKGAARDSVHSFPSATAGIIARPVEQPARGG